MTSYAFTSGVSLKGMDTTGAKYPVFCDHTHLYSFFYDSVTPADSSDSDTDLDVWAWSMTGFSGFCNYYDWSAVDMPVKEGKPKKSVSDSFTTWCGYYTLYEWSGNGDVFWEIHSMDAVVKAAGSLAVIALASLYL